MALVLAIAGVLVNQRSRYFGDVQT